MLQKIIGLAALAWVIDFILVFREALRGYPPHGALRATIAIKFGLDH